MTRYTLSTPDTIYTDVASDIGIHLETLRGYTTELRLQDLMRRVQTTDPSTIDYEDYCVEYAQLYWMRNYWKSVYLYEYEYHLKHTLLTKIQHDSYALQVTSLGSGPAADVVALLVWLYAHRYTMRVHLTLIDKSPSQAHLVQSIIARASDRLVGMQVTVECRCIDVDMWAPRRDSVDILVMGHFLTANRAHIDSIMRRAQYAVGPGGDILIMERDRDPVWQIAEDTLLNMALTCQSYPLESDKLLHMIESYTDETVDQQVTPRYLRASVPMHKDHISLVKKYFDSWRRQTTDWLADIFASDATYDEKPGVEPALHGIGSIYEYWERNPLRQRSIDVYIRSIAYDEGTIVCAFEGDFDTSKQHIAIRGAMDFKIDMYTQKVRSFQSYFGTVKNPHIRRHA